MPVREGTVALLGPFIDTLTICTITGLIIITTGAYQEKFEDQIQYGVKASITVAKPDQSLDLPRIQEVPDKLLYQGPLEIKDGIPQNVVLIYNHATIEEPRFYKNDSLFSGKFDVDKLNRIKESNGEVASFWIKGRAIQNGSPLTTSAFNKGLAFLGSNVIGSFLVTISVFLFAISTAISWSYYGDRATQYLWGNWAILPYKFVYMGMNFLGAIFSLELVWGFGDVALGIMTIPNLIAVNLLTRRVKRETDKYYQQKSW